MKLKENTFFDINKLPAKEGIILFPISMSRISNAQIAIKCFNHLNHLAKKIAKKETGLNVIYGDYLYFNSDEKASKLKDKFISLIVSHKYNFINILRKNPWYIKKSISFTTWNQQILQKRQETTKIYQRRRKISR
jgi:hypothetical protein